MSPTMEKQIAYPKFVPTVNKVAAEAVLNDAIYPLYLDVNGTEFVVDYAALKNHDPRLN